MPNPDSSTILNFITLIRDKVINDKVLILYLYYRINARKSPSRATTREETGLAFDTIDKHAEKLEELGVLRRRRVKGGKYILETKELVLTVSSTKRIYSSSRVSSLDHSRDKRDLDRSRRLEGSRETRSRKKKRWGLVSVKNDKDYQFARDELEKHFKKHEIDPKQLTRKNRFDHLCELLLDEDFDFPSYCEWFAREKYNSTGFNFGIFLYPNIIGEFRDQYAEEDVYLRTASHLSKSESHAKGIRKTNEFLDKILNGEKNEGKRKTNHARTKGRASREVR